MRVSQLLAALLCAGALAACSSGDASDSEPKASPRAATTTTSEPVDNTRGEPSVGGRALRVGESRNGTDVTTTVTKVVDDYTKGAGDVEDILEEEGGGRWVAAFVRHCINKDAEPIAEPLQVLPLNFSLGTATGSTYTTPSSSKKFPSPRLETVAITTGCREGWVNFAVPEGVTVDRVFVTDFVSNDVPYAEWRF